jgi:long-chain acyl-CoA synthetase
MPDPDPAQPAIVPGLWGIAGQEPDRRALIVPGGETVTFGGLAAATHRLANTLRALGVGAGDVVASLQHNSVQHFEVSLATSRIGVYFVPVNVHLTPPEATYIARDSGAKVLVASGDLAQSLAGELDDLPERRFAVGDPVSGWESYDALTSSAADTSPSGRTHGWLMGYTSGTSGRPKGVKRPYFDVEPELVIGGFTGLLGGFGLTPGPGVHLACSPMYHSPPGTFAQQALHLGQTLVIERKFRAEDALVDIERYRVTSTHMVPTHLHRMLRLPAEVREKYDTSSMWVLLVAGAPFPPEEKRAAIEWLGPVVWEYLASTEGMVSRVSPREALEHPGTVGRPQAVKLLDADGIEVSPGEAGTIFFNNELGFEYPNDADKTAAAVRPDGYATAGDIGRLDADGYLYLLDRRDDLIITGGVNVYPAEVEQRLIVHPAIADVAVVGIPDPDWGHRVIAVVELEDGWASGDQLEAELDAHCRVTSAMLTLSRHPQQRDWLMADFDGRITQAIEEFVRYATAAMQFARTAVRDVELNGVQVTAGDKVVLLYCSGNRDESVFTAPEEFNLARPRSPHVGFGGGGPHFCLGHGVARTQLRAIIGQLLTRVPGLELGEPVPLHSNFINGIAALPAHVG